MAVTSDPIADFLIRFKNAARAEKEEFLAPHSQVKEEIARYNTFVANKLDEDFKKPIPDDAQTIDEPPFYGVRLWPKVHHCMGGVKTDLECRVVDMDLQVIPGLYAAGEVTGGIHGTNRLGGNALADIVTFGHIAGQQAYIYTRLNK